MKHSIKQEILKNESQLTVISAPDSSVVEARIFFKAGFEHFTTKDFHLPHILEHLLVGNGSLFKDEQEFLHALQELGATINASTDFIHLTIMLRAPKDTFMEAFDIALDSVFKMQFSQDILDEQRQIILREIYEQHDSLGSQVVNASFSRMFNSLSPEDWHEHITNTQALTVDDVRAAYKQFIIPKDMQVVLAGNITNTDKKHVQESLSAIKTSGRIATQLDLKRNTESFFEGVAMDEDGSGGLTMLFASDAIKEDDLPRRVARSFALMLLLGAPTAILQTTLRQKGMVYSIDSDAIELTDTRIEMIHVMTAPTQTHEAAIEVMKYMRLYAAGHIPAAELESVRKYVIHMLSTSVETVEDLISWYSRDLLAARKLRSPDEEIAAIKEIDVKDVAKAVQELFVDSTLYGAAACGDAPSWASEIAKIHEDVDLTLSENDMRQLMSEWMGSIQEMRTSLAQTRGGYWDIYYLSSFATLLTTMFVSQLPVKGDKHTISAINFALHHPAWGFSFFIPLFTANFLLLCVQGKSEIKATRIGISLMMIASAVYIFGLFHYFGDVGVDNQPWMEDVASILQPVFFLIFTPMAFGSTLRYIMLERKRKQ